VAQVERRWHRDLLVTRDQMQLGADVFNKSVKGDLTLENADRSYMERGLFLLHVKESGVLRTQALAITPLGH
jgi:hypothetical protein